jgi:two-component system response regulator
MAVRKIGGPKMRILLIEDRSPHAILLDVQLPDVDGTELLRALKNDERTRRIPVVVLTAVRDPQILHTCYELGVNSYVLKPQQTERFETVVREVGKYWVHLNEPPIH